MEGNMETGFRNNGFTLIELVVVVLIVAVLAGISIPVYGIYVNKAKLTLSINNLSNMRKVLEVYATEYDTYPKTLDLTTFTDQVGVAIADSSTIEKLKGNVYSFESYTFVTPSYTLVAKGLDSKHTVITVTPSNITY